MDRTNQNRARYMRTLPREGRLPSDKMRRRSNKQNLNKYLKGPFILKLVEKLNTHFPSQNKLCNKAVLLTVCNNAINNLSHYKVNQSIAKQELLTLRQRIADIQIPKNFNKSNDSLRQEIKNLTEGNENKFQRERFEPHFLNTLEICKNIYIASVSTLTRIKYSSIRKNKFVEKYLGALRSPFQMIKDFETLYKQGKTLFPNNSSHLTIHFNKVNQYIGKILEEIKLTHRPEILAKDINQQAKKLYARFEDMRRPANLNNTPIANRRRTKAYRQFPPITNSNRSKSPTGKNVTNQQHNVQRKLPNVNWRIVSKYIENISTILGKANNKQQVTTQKTTTKSEDIGYTTIKQFEKLKKSLTMKNLLVDNSFSFEKLTSVQQQLAKTIQWAYHERKSYSSSINNKQTQDNTRQLVRQDGRNFGDKLTLSDIFS